VYKFLMLFILSTFLIITACASPEPTAPNTATPTAAITFTPTKTATKTATLSAPTNTTEPTFTPSPEIIAVRTEATYHVVEEGDTLLSLAEKYHLSPESILFSNFDVQPYTLVVGMTLVIPPIDGFYYTWKGGDVLPDLAYRFGVSMISILTWPENGLDREIEEIEPGKILFIPGGKNPYFDWVRTPGPLGIATSQP
jgi:LysM repeat protein